MAANNNLVLAWPANAGGFVLQSTATLSPTGWADLDPQPPVVQMGGFNTVTLPVGSGNHYYRLRQ